MKFNSRIIVGALLLSGWIGTAAASDATVTVRIADASAASAATVASAASAASVAGVATDAGDASAPAKALHRHGRHEHTLVSVGHNATLPAGEHADNVVSVLGSSVSAGDVSGDVVAVMGNARVTGPVAGDVVAVMGNTYIDSQVGGDVVAVMGKVELGPHADVGGEIDAVGGAVMRDPSAIVHGTVEADSAGMQGFDFGWLQNWVTHCLLKGRLLAFGHGLGWAWTVALISLASYVLVALLMPRTVDKCVRVLDDHPGESLLAAFLTTLATPVLMVLLCITVIGILAIPFLGFALVIASSFGRVVILAWMGTRILRSTSADAGSAAAAVTVGGLIVMALYVVPVIGMITFQLVGFIGIGVIAYALLLGLREKRQSTEAPLAAAASVAAAAAPASAEAASVAPGTATPGGAAPDIMTPGVTIPAAGAAASYPRAGFWIRMFALFIDVLLVSVIVHVVLDAGRAHLLLLAAYGAVMWKLKGATVGGLICHLHVVRLDGRPIDWSTAIVRALSCFLSLIVAGLGFIWIAIDGERQAWHDKIAGTIVVQVPKGVSLV
ncbi:MAG: RDD family protein [Steroidobacterales bacterium]